MTYLCGHTICAVISALFDEIDLPNLSRNTSPSIVRPNRITHKMYTVDVVMMAPIVPFGMLLPASARSPERFEPAMMPVHDGKKMPTRMAMLVVISAVIHNFRLVASLIIF